MIVYVDDIIIPSDGIYEIAKPKLKLRTNFRLKSKDLRKMRYFLGKEIAKSKDIAPKFEQTERGIYWIEVLFVKNLMQMKFQLTSRNEIFLDKLRRTSNLANKSLGKIQMRLLIFS